MIEKDFWKHKALTEMTSEEWEALCCKCGICCLYKIEDPNTGEIKWTNIACRYLDFETSTCQVYNGRLNAMSTCINLTPSNVESFEYLPENCAYRVVARGDPLPDWHPLISGDPNSISQNPNKLDFSILIKDTRKTT